MLFKPSEDKSPEISSLAPFVKYYDAVDNRPTAFVCRDYKCSLPTIDPVRMVQLLNKIN